MSAGGHGQARAALRRVWPDARTLDQAQIRSLGGGLSARSYLVVAGERRHVLRLPVPGSIAWLDVATEARAMRAAAAADLAPAVIAVDVEAGLLLTDYRTTLWAPDLVRQPAVVTMIVRLLRALHRLEVDLPVYSVEGFTSTYLAALAATGVRALSAEEGRWAVDLTKLGHQFDATYAPTAFCHNDLVAANILIDGAAARLIDFEYAGRGASLLDLASLAGMNDFNEAQRRQLLDEYYGTVPAAPSMHDLDNAVRMVRLLAYFWGRVAEKRLADPRAHVKLAASIGATLRQG
ncbi:MAG TPA: phosphotransferase [Gammaproteobacteria bacterium]|nr:phosphotransferase [Gammaproteobacteria bacterium]